MPRFVPSPLLLLVFSTVASAADPIPPFEEFRVRTRAHTAQNKDVQAELKLTDEQVRDLTARFDAVAVAHDTEVKRLRGAEMADVEKGVAKLSADTTAAVGKAVAEVLSKPQLARLREVELQQMGAGAALGEADVQAALGVDKSQREKLTALADDLERKLSRLKREAGGVQTTRTIPDTDLAKAGQQSLAGATVVSLRKEYNLACKLVLTPEQLKKWDDLRGPPFPKAGPSK